MKTGWHKALNLGVVLALLVSLAVAFFPQPALANNPNWYGADWTYRQKITIDHTQVADAAPYTDFPVLVYATGLSNILADGADIRFTSSDGTTELPREIESYSDGTLYAWVKVTLTKDAGDSTDDVIYMYYGNSGASEPAVDDPYGAENVWDANFQMVQHMKDTTTSTITDSTLNDKDGTKVGAGAPAEAADGQIDRAQDFDGINDYIAIGTIDPDTVTVSAWAKSISAEKQDIVNNQQDAWSLRLVEQKSFPPSFTALIAAEYYKAQFDSFINDGEWHYIVGTFDGETVRIYVDGSDTGSTPNTDPSGNLDAVTGSVFIGIHANGTANPVNGEIDEVRISNTARSAEWIATEYNNQNSPGTFTAFGDQEQQWESYQLTGRTTVWGTVANPYNSTYHIAYMKGGGFTASHDYKIGYYDGDGSQASSVEAQTSDGDGVLTGAYDITTDVNVTAGTWHSVVFDTTGNIPDNITDARADLNYIFEDDFEVSVSAIPEFPTVFAAIGVAGLCFVIYYRMRKKRLAPVHIKV